MKRPHAHGAITVRSNVVMDSDRWDLVPGELLHAIGRGRDRTPLQHDEHMYYEPCSVCERTIAEINLTGCTRCRHAPTPSEILGAQDAHREQVAAARRREASENAAIAARSPLKWAGIRFDPPLDQLVDEGAGRPGVPGLEDPLPPV